MINEELADERNINSKDRFKIECLHNARENMHSALYQAHASFNRKLVKAIADVLPQIEEELQKLWGFPVDINYYKFWEVGGCVCSKIDNSDNYPHGYYVVNNSCWLHGEEKNEQIQAGV